MTRHANYGSPARAGSAEDKGPRHYDSPVMVDHVEDKVPRNSDVDSNNNSGGTNSTSITDASAVVSTVNTSISTSEGHASNNNNPGTVSVAAGGPTVKYGLRPRSGSLRFQHCIEDQDFITECAPRTRPGHKPRFLSRYRRKTANARERGRMQQINNAFETLRGILPDGNFCSKAPPLLTKISTLKLAAAYIRTLQDILDNGADGQIYNESAESSYSWLLASLLQENQQVDVKPENFQPIKRCRSNSPWLEQLLNPEMDTVKHSRPSSPWLGQFNQQEQSPCLKSEYQPHSIVSDGAFLYGDSCGMDLDSLPFLSPMAETDALSLLLGSKASPSIQTNDTVLV